jgi:TonB family protein
MTTLVAGIGLAIATLLVVLFAIFRRRNPQAPPLALLPLAFTPIGLAGAGASYIVIQGFRGLASGEATSLATAFDAISHANEWLVAAHGVSVAILVLIAVAILFTLPGHTSRTKTVGLLRALAVATTVVVALGALALSPVATRSLSFPIAVIASDDGKPIQDPTLPRIRQAQEDLNARAQSVGEVSMTVARHLTTTAGGSLALLFFSILGFVLTLVSSENGLFPKALGMGGLFVAVLSAGASGARFLHHRALSQEIARVIENRAVPPTPPVEELATVPLDGKDLVAPVKIHDVAPVYPPEAVQARVEGDVVVEAIIDVRGNVQEVRILESVPLLDQAALHAVKQWKYTPATLNAKPTPIVLTVNVSFRLD